MSFVILGQTHSSMAYCNEEYIWAQVHDIGWDSHEDIGKVSDLVEIQFS